MFNMFNKFRALYVFKVTKSRIEVWVDKVAPIVDLKRNKKMSFKTRMHFILDASPDKTCFSYLVY